MSREAVHGEGEPVESTADGAESVNEARISMASYSGLAGVGGVRPSPWSRPRNLDRVAVVDVS